MVPSQTASWVRAAPQMPSSLPISSSNGRTVEITTSTMRDDFLDDPVHHLLAVEDQHHVEQEEQGVGEDQAGLGTLLLAARLGDPEGGQPDPPVELADQLGVEAGAAESVLAGDRGEGVLQAVLGDEVGDARGVVLDAARLQGVAVDPDPGVELAFEHPPVELVFLGRRVGRRRLQDHLEAGRLELLFDPLLQALRAAGRGGVRLDGRLGVRLDSRLDGRRGQPRRQLLAQLAGPVDHRHPMRRRRLEQEERRQDADGGDEQRQHDRRQPEAERLDPGEVLALRDDQRPAKRHRRLPFRRHGRARHRRPPG